VHSDGCFSVSTEAAAAAAAAEAVAGGVVVFSVTCRLPWGGAISWLGARGSIGRMFKLIGALHDCAASCCLLLRPFGLDRRAPAAVVVVAGGSANGHDERPLIAEGDGGTDERGRSCDGCCCTLPWSASVAGLAAPSERERARELAGEVETRGCSPLLALCGEGGSIDECTSEKLAVLVRSCRRGACHSRGAITSDAASRSRFSLIDGPTKARRANRSACARPRYHDHARL
jgi:hypothetical protein